MDQESATEELHLKATSQALYFLPSVSFYAIYLSGSRRQSRDYVIGHIGLQVPTTPATTNPPLDSFAEKDLSLPYSVNRDLTLGNMAFFGQDPGHPGEKTGCYIILDHYRKYLPLHHLDARVSILSSTSRTTLTQTFVNPVKEEIKQARYSFPLYDGVSVVAFTCTIGSRVIRGAVKERQEAKKEFEDAVSQGSMAGLLEHSLEASDVFTTTIGNIPAGEDVKVEIIYLGELKHDAEIDGLRFTIPTSIAPRYGDSSVDATYSGIEGARISVAIDADMAEGSAIKSIESPSHPISVNIGATSVAPAAAPSLQRAFVKLGINSSELGKDFILQITATGLGDPAALLETHPSIPNQRALMTTLVPRFNLPVQRPEVVFLCDRSGSMQAGQQMPNLIAALEIFLKSLPVGIKFNICSFGSRFSFFSEISQPYNQDTLEKAVSHVKRFAADYGGTEMYQPLQEIFRRRLEDTNLEVFLITDGEIWAQTELFKMIESEVAKSKGAIRVFSLGIGLYASHALVEGVARAGNGFAQTVSENERMDKKIVRMLKGALTPHIYDYTLEIKYEKGLDDKGPSGGTAEHDDDDGFELVESLMDAVTIDSTLEGEARIKVKEEEVQKKTVSLFNESVNDADLEIPQASDLPAVKIPAVFEPRYLQTPFKIPTLFPFIRTTVYVLLADSTPSLRPKSVLLRGTCDQANLELEIPISNLTEKGTTIHQLAAKKAVGELEEGCGWIYHAKTGQGKLLKDEFETHFRELVKREAARLGVQYQISGRWCSFVAIQDKDHAEWNGQGAGEFELVPAVPPSPGTQPSMISPMLFMRAAVPMAGSRGGSITRSKFKRHVAPAPPNADDAYQSIVPNLGATSLSVASHFESAPTDAGLSQPEVEAQDDPQPVALLAQLQSYIGSWAWDPQLEKVLGLTREQASSLNLTCQHCDEDEVLATLCTVVFLRKKLADERETWELFVEKAEEWLSTKTGTDAKDLEKTVEERLFP